MDTQVLVKLLLFSNKLPKFKEENSRAKQVVCEFISASVHQLTLPVELTLCPPTLGDQ